MLTKEEIRSVLQSNNLNGKSISIHSSYKSLGKVNGGPQAIIDTFLEEDCTLLAPTFSYSYMRGPIKELSPKNNAWDYNVVDEYGANTDDIYNTDSKILDSNMGIISKLILEMQNSYRGNNPLDSFSAVGHKSEELTKYQTAIDIYSSFKNLIEDDGFVVLIGVSYDRMTLIHHCEKEIGRNMFIRWALDKKSRTIPVETGGCSAGFINMSKELDKLAIEVKVGLSIWKIYRAKDVYKSVKSILEADPEITRCSDKSCIYCRDAILGGATYE